MNSIELTTTEFRQNQKKFLDLASQGASIFICRGKEMFMLNRVPLQNRLDQDTLNRIEQARNEINAGSCTSISTPDELNDFLASL